MREAWSARSDSLTAFGARNTNKEFGACTIESRWQQDAVLRLPGSRKMRSIALEWVRCLSGSPSSART